MKLVLFNGSSRNNGNTNKLLKIIESKLDNKLYSISFINISENKISYCTGCHQCEITRSCHQNDDMNIIYDILKESDLIIMASPSYWGYVTGNLKVFFDRSTPYCNTINNQTTFPEGKKGIAISIRAGSKKSENEEIIKSIEHYFSHLEIQPLKSFQLESITDVLSFENEQNKLKINDFIEYLNYFWRNSS